MNTKFGSLLLCSIGLFMFGLVLQPSPGRSQQPEIELNHSEAFFVNGEINSSIHRTTTIDTSTGSTRQSNVSVNQVDLNLSAAIGNHMDVETTLEYEEEPDRQVDENQGELDVDEAYIVIADHEDLLLPRDEQLGQTPLALRIGKFELPFANHLQSREAPNLTDSQTYELGELEESAVMLTYYSQAFPIVVHASAYRGQTTFGSDSGVKQRQHLTDFQAGFDLRYGWTDWSFQYTNALTNGSALSQQLNGEVPRVGGYNVYFSSPFGPSTVGAEWVRAADSLSGAELDSYAGPNDDKLYPSALSAAWTLHREQALAFPFDLTVRYETTADWPGHPETSWGLVAERKLTTRSNFSVHYLERKFDETITDTGLQDETIVLAQFTAKFGFGISTPKES